MLVAGCSDSSARTPGFWWLDGDLKYIVGEASPGDRWDWRFGRGNESLVEPHWPRDSRQVIQTWDYLVDIAVSNLIFMVFSSFWSPRTITFPFSLKPAWETPWETLPKRCTWPLFNFCFKKDAVNTNEDHNQIPLHVPLEWLKFKRQGIGKEGGQLALPRHAGGSGSWCHPTPTSFTFHSLMCTQQTCIHAPVHQKIHIQMALMALPRVAPNWTQTSIKRVGLEKGHQTKKCSMARRMKEHGYNQ